MTKIRATTIILFFVIGVAMALENYMDYGNENPNSEKAKIKSKMLDYLLSRELDDYSNFASQQLQPRAAERSSPSLRLRFGRSFSKYPRSPSLRLRFGRSYPSSVDVSKLNIGGSSNPELDDM